MYVDECLFSSLQESDIDKAIADIKGRGMDCQVEDSIAAFLGVHIDQYTVEDEQGTKVKQICLLQTGLID